MPLDKQLAAGEFEHPDWTDGGGAESAGGLARWSHKSLGVRWWIVGLTSYGVMSVIARQLFHDPEAARVFRAEVPPVYHDLSLLVFSTVFMMDLLNVVFESKNTKLDFVLLPAFIKGLATLTNLIIINGWGTIAFAASGRIIVVQRFICWLHTTAAMLQLVKMISKTVTQRQAFRAMMFCHVTLITGAVTLTLRGWPFVFGAITAHTCVLPSMMLLHHGLSEGIQVARATRSAPVMWVGYFLVLAMWISNGVAWDLAALNITNMAQEEALNLFNDFTSKVLFSSSLMLSSFKHIEMRREHAMRSIEDSGKQKLVEELQGVLEQKDRFLSNVSHELRTPLNGIIGITEGLLAGSCGALAEQTRRQLYIIRTSGARLLSLINDVVDATALRHNNLVLRQEQVWLRSLVGDVMDLTRTLVSPDVELQNWVPGELSVWGDCGRIVQMLNNLIGNSAKFTRMGYIRVTGRRCRGTNGAAQVALSVLDTGVGIPKPKLHSIFSPFEQVDTSISRKYGGVGLGLNITYELVKAHGGAIYVSSAERKGTCFTVVLPIGEPPPLPPPAPTDGPSTPARAASRLRPVRAANEGGAAKPALAAAGVAGEGDPSLGEQPSQEDLPYDSAQLAAMASSRSMRGAGAEDEERVGTGARQRRGDDGSPRAAPGGGADPEAPGPEGPAELRQHHFEVTGQYQIVAVDDDITNLQVIEALLAPRGYQVMCLPGGKELLEHLLDAEVLPDLVLLDYMMPDLSGLEVIRRLKDHFPALYSRLSIIMVSAASKEETVVAGLDLGVVDYVTKPFRRLEFLARVDAKLAAPPGSFPAAEPVRSSPGDGGSVVAPAASATSTGSVEPAGQLVLCVDDDEVHQMVLEGMLLSNGYRHVRARRIADALRLFEAVEPVSGARLPAGAVAQQLPDLVLLEASLPDADGLELLRMIRQRYNQRQLPVIMLTARYNESSIAAAMACGASDYVVKPFRRAELLARMRMHLRAADSRTTALSPRRSQEMRRSLSAPILSDAPEGVAGPVDGATLPVLAAQVEGLDRLSIGAQGPELTRLLGRIHDTFASLAEKYAVDKVESADDTFVAVARQDPAAVAQGGLAAAAPPPLTPLLQLASELMFMMLGPAKSAARRPGVLSLRVALHVGPVHWGVVGVQRPRHRLFGAALPVALAAARASPLNAVVASDAAAAQLRAQGLLRELQQLPPAAAGVGAPQLPEGVEPLWLVFGEWMARGVALGGEAPVAGGEASGSRAPGGRGSPSSSERIEGLPSSGPLSDQAAVMMIKGELEAVKEQLALLREMQLAPGAGTLSGDDSSAPLPALGAQPSRAEQGEEGLVQRRGFHPA